MSEKFTCEVCGGTFDPAWTVAEAEAEAEARFGVKNASEKVGPGPEDLAVVCDECFEHLKARERRAGAVEPPDINDRSRCYHCGASGVPLIEWQPDPPRPDIPGPFPMHCANGCGRSSPLRITLEGDQTLEGVTPGPAGVFLLIENRGGGVLVTSHERPARAWDLDTEGRECLANGQPGDRVKWHGVREPARLHTVPWDPELGELEEITGRVLRALRLAAELATAAGWSASTLPRHPRFFEPSLNGALVRTAVRLGLIV